MRDHAPSSPDAELQRICLDAIRGYYRAADITASAFRIETLYRALGEGEGVVMKRFLMETVAWRVGSGRVSTGLRTQVIHRADGVPVEGLTASFRGLLGKWPRVAVDYAAVLERSGKGLKDPRRCGAGDEAVAADGVGELADGVRHFL